MTVSLSRTEPGVKAQMHADEELGLAGFRAMDRMREALTAQLTGGLSPASIALALFDWSIHLASAPGKRLELMDKAFRKSRRLATYLAAASSNPATPPCIEPLPGDYRFAAEGWEKQPFAFLAQAFLLNQQWWHNVTREVPGVTPHHEEVVSFAAANGLTCSRPPTFLSPIPRS